MKKMMTNMKTLVALLMAGAAVTSCSSDNEMDSLKAPAGKTYTMTVQATKGGDAMTRALELGAEGKTLTATWATTENVYVKKDDAWATGSLKPQTAGASTTLKGTLSGVTIEATNKITLQFPKSGDITYAGQKGTLADIAANFDYAIAKDITVVDVDDAGNIDTGENAIEFDHQQAIVRFTLKNSDGTALPSNPTAFTMTDGTSTVELTNIPAETYTTNGGDGVLYVAFPASNGSADITLTATVGTDTYTCTASSKTFTVGNFYRVTAKMTKQANGPEAVDLGLPSGTLWANMNVGAARESDFGKYFAWGETTGYDSSDGRSFGWANYSLCNGSQTTMTKYCNKEGYGTVDNKTTLEAADDAATANWGSPWRMPTKAEMQELVDTQNNTTDYTWELTTVDGHKGYRITRKSTGANIFLPASGNYGSSLYDLNYYGYYWSSSLDEESGSNPSNSYYLGTNNTKAGVYNWNSRYLGLSVRPVQ